MNGEERLLIDPERVTVAAANRGKGKNAIDNFEMSNDGKYLAVGIVPDASEHDTELHIVETDPAVFGYGVAPSIEVDPRCLSSIIISPDSNFAVGVIETGISPERLFYMAPVKAIDKPDIPWRKIADFADDVSDIAIRGDDLYLRTFRNAPRSKVMRTDAPKPDLPSAETIVPRAQAVVTDISPAWDGLYVRLLDGGISRLLRVPYGPAPNVEPVLLPFEGDLSLATDPRIAGVLLTMTSWTKAPTIYIYNSSTKQVRDTKLQPVGPYDDPANVAAEEVKVESYDGTVVPLSIVHPKGMKLDGSNPTALIGYGSYGASEAPPFDRTYLAWHELGGIVAVCHAWWRRIWRTVALGGKRRHQAQHIARLHRLRRVSNRKKVHICGSFGRDWRRRWRHSDRPRYNRAARAFRSGVHPGWYLGHTTLRNHGQWRAQHSRIRQRED